jgi:hypothetical protein
MQKPDVTVPETAAPSELVVTDDVEGTGDEATSGSQSTDERRVGEEWISRCWPARI